MLNETEITVKGWVGQHPRTSVTRNGGTMTTLRVGTTPRRRDAATGEWRDGQTSWFSVLVFGDLADNVARSMRKGDPVLVRGRCSLKRSEYQGKEHLNAEIVADAIGPELSRGTALYAPMVRRSRDADDVAGHTGAPTGFGDGDGGLSDLSFPLDLDSQDDEADRADLDESRLGDEAAHGAGAEPAGPDELVGTP